MNTDELRSSILTSRLGAPDALPCSLDVDELAKLYDTELLAIADGLAPARTVTVRRRSSDPWYDDKCRAAKKAVLAAERISRRSQSSEHLAQWRSLRRAYRALRKQKSETYWRDRVDSECGCPRSLWASFDAILGRRDVPATGEIDASAPHEFFDRKMDAICAATSQATSPLFLPVRTGSVLKPVTVDDVVGHLQVT